MVVYNFYNDLGKMEYGVEGPVALSDEKIKFLLYTTKIMFQNRKSFYWHMEFMDTLQDIVI